MKIFHCLVALANELFGCSLQELIDIEQSVKTCDERQFDWNKNATELVLDFQNESSVRDDDREENDVVVNSEVKSYSQSEAEQYITHLQEFALVHGNCKLMNSVMEMKDTVTAILYFMHVSC